MPLYGGTSKRSSRIMNRHRRVFHYSKPTITASEGVSAEHFVDLRAAGTRKVTGFLMRSARRIFLPAIAAAVVIILV
jgi:hypothetical protein